MCGSGWMCLTYYLQLYGCSTCVILGPSNRRFRNSPVNSEIVWSCSNLFYSKIRNLNPFRITFILVDTAYEPAKGTFDSTGGSIRTTMALIAVRGEWALAESIREPFPNALATCKPVRETHTTFALIVLWRVNNDLAAWFRLQLSPLDLRCSGRMAGRSATSSGSPEDPG